MHSKSKVRQWRKRGCARDSFALERRVVQHLTRVASLVYRLEIRGMLPGRHANTHTHTHGAVPRLSAERRPAGQWRANSNAAFVCSSNTVPIRSSSARYMHGFLHVFETQKERYELIHTLYLFIRLTTATAPCATSCHARIPQTGPHTYLGLACCQRLRVGPRPRCRWNAEVSSFPTVPCSRFNSQAFPRSYLGPQVRSGP